MLEKLSKYDFQHQFHKKKNQIYRNLIHEIFDWWRNSYRKHQGKGKIRADTK